MLNLILAILTSAMVAIMMRLAQPRVKYPTGLLVANYIVCTITALILSLPQLPGLSSAGVGFPAGLGALNGFFYLSGFVLMQYNTRHNGVVLSSRLPPLWSSIITRALPSPVAVGFCF